jgi:hypothetical protein
VTRRDENALLGLLARPWAKLSRAERNAAILLARYQGQHLASEQPDLKATKGAYVRAFVRKARARGVITDDEERLWSRSDANSDPRLLGFESDLRDTRCQNEIKALLRRAREGHMDRAE